MLMSEPGQEQPLSASLSPDTRELLIRSTRANLRLQRHGPGPVPLHTHTRASAADGAHTESSAAPRPSRAPPPPGEEELQTIRLAAGGRGAGLEALRQRSQSAPHRRQVRVTLLDSHSAPGQDSNSHDAPGAAVNMEKVSELTESVQRLLQNYRGQAVTEETLQRLEMLHNQQLTLQNQLLDSALKMVLRPQAPPSQQPSCVSMETRDTPTAAVPMETLPVTVVPPTDSLSLDHSVAADRLRANESTEEAGLRAQQVLMEMERLRTELRAALTQRQEPEKPPPPPSPSKAPRPKSSRSFRNTGRSSIAQPNYSPHRHQSHAQSAHPPRTSPKTLTKPDRREPRSHQEPGGEERNELLHQQHHRNYIQYLQNRIKDKQQDPEKHRNAPEISEKSTKDWENATVGHEMEMGGEERQDQGKENVLSTLGLRQDLRPVLGSSGGLRQDLRPVLGSSRGLRQDPGLVLGSSGGLRQDPGPVLGSSGGLRQDPGPVLGSSGGLRQDPGLVLGSSGGLRQDPGPVLGSSGGLRQDPGPVLGSSGGLRQDPGPVLGSSGGLRQDLRPVLGSSGGSGLQGPRTVLEGPESPGSALDEARLVLKKVQRQRKVLEENLETQLRARSGELLHCWLNALSQNRDCSDELRIKNTVDLLIRDIQMERAAANQRSATAKASANRKAVDRRNTAPSANKGSAERRNAAASANRSAAERRKPAPSGRALRATSGPSRPSPAASVDPVPVPVPVPVSVPVQSRSADLSCELEERLRRVYGKAAHEGQRRSLKRSPYLRMTSPVSPDRSRPRPRLVQSVRGVKLKSCKTQTSDPGPGPSPGLSPAPVRSGPGFPVVAVPLGRSRTGPYPRAPQEVTTPPSSPPPPPPPQQEVTSQPNASPQKEDDGRTEEREQPRQNSSDPVVVKILRQEEEEVEFPGTLFLSVADLQQSEAGSEADPGGPGGPEEVLQLEGGPGPDPVQYQGPQFPPEPPSSSLPPAQGQSLELGLGLHRDPLEERLVQWVEQQLMSRIISEMYRPPLSDPTHSPYTAQSEPLHRPEHAHTAPPVQSEPGAASNLGHGDSLRLEVDCGVDLDPDLVRGLVLEVLAEIVALFLGSRETEHPETGPRTGPGSDPDPGAEADPTQATPSETQEALIPTPEATPPQTPPPADAAQAPPLSPVATPRATPPPSDLPAAQEEDPPPEPVATPPPTPCPDNDDDAPLDEPEPSPPESSPAPAAVAPPPGPPSPPDSSPSSSESSVSTATSVTAARHISEGELLLSQRHLQALHEENVSFCSSLHELQDMDLDPPSEGQLHNNNSSRILLSFINKLQLREPRPPPEGAWGRGPEEEEEMSAGEIKGTANQSRSPGQTSPITGEALGWTNQSTASEGLLTSDLLEAGLAQADAQDSAPKRSSVLGLDQDQGPPQLQEQSPQSHGEDAAEGGVWGERGPVKLQVFVPSAAAESPGSDSSSDVF